LSAGHEQLLRLVLAEIRFLDSQSGTTAKLDDGYIKFWVTYTYKAKP
jgi:hypothetical protein